jgi:hypothetical protein
MARAELDLAPADLDGIGQENVGAGEVDFHRSFAMAGLPPSPRLRRTSTEDPAKLKRSRCPGHPRTSCRTLRQNVDARDKPGHDEFQDKRLEGAPA